MANEWIPLRPSNDGEHNISKADKECLSYQIIFGVSNETAFARFHPEYLTENGRLNRAGKMACKQFFIYAKNRSYSDDYKTTLETFVKEKNKERTALSITNENRTERVVKKLVSDVLDSIESNNNLDPEALKDFVEVAKKLGVLKDEEEQEIRPLRFLPETCNSCRARIFVESAVANGDVLDMCQYCKARKVAEEHQYRFNEKDLLDIPKDVTDEIEAKNNITVADILSGKVEN